MIITLIFSAVCIIFIFSVATFYSEKGLSSLARFNNEILALYFSQFNLYQFNKQDWRNNIKHSIYFIVSWILIIVTLYAVTIFLLIYIVDVGLTIKHKDTLLLALILFTTSIRFHVFKFGRHSGEFFKTTITSLFYVWILVAGMSKTFDVFKTVVFQTDWGKELFSQLNMYSQFSVKHDFIGVLQANAPDNRFIMLLGLAVFLFVEFIYYKYSDRLNPDKCNMWNVCFETNLNINRILGRKNIEDKVQAILNKAVSTDNIKWAVTTPIKTKFYETIKKKRIAAKIIFLNEQAINEDFTTTDNIEIKNNIDISKNGFLIVGDRTLLITTQRHPVMQTQKPTIGFFSEDANVVSKFLETFRLIDITSV